MSEISRRQMLAGLTGIYGTLLATDIAKADVIAGADGFPYEVTRSDQDWQSMLGDDYPILRLGKTELPRSSPHWAEAREGVYQCKGCDLTQYSSTTKVNLLKGWVFFTASETNSQLMAQDSAPVMDEAGSAFDVSIEVHCRRCGSHIGHILKVEGRALHCVNGASLNFQERPA